MYIFFFCCSLLTNIVKHNVGKGIKDALVCYNYERKRNLLHTVNITIAPKNLHNIIIIIFININNIIIIIII